MDPAWLIALCSIGGTLGGAFGAWMSVKITLAVQSERIDTLGKEIGHLRDAKHEHADLIQSHEAKFHMLEKGIWKI